MFSNMKFMCPKPTDDDSPQKEKKKKRLRWQ
jgi:hypothetical protein